MFADDVAAVVTAPTTSDLKQKLSDVAKQLCDWFRINGLALNLAKTCFIRFSLATKPQEPINVAVGNTAIQQVHTVKLLGFYVDSGLKWNTHIDTLCARLGQACFALSRLAASAPRHTVLGCYFATVHSLLAYGTELWGTAAERERALILQKRAIRAIVRVPSDVSAKPYFIELNILTVPSIYIYQISLFVRMNIDKFETLGAAHRFSTRNRNRLRIPSHRLKKSQKSPYVIGVTIFNKLPDVIKDAKSDAVFRNKLKQFLIKQAFYSVSEFVEDR